MLNTINYLSKYDTTPTVLLIPHSIGDEFVDVFHEFRRAILLANKQGELPLTIRQDLARSFLQKHFSRLQILTQKGQVERSVSIIVLDIHFGLVFDQKLNDFRSIRQCSQVNRSPSLEVHRFQLSHSLLHNQLGQRHQISLTSEVKREVLVIVGHGEVARIEVVHGESLALSND